MAMLSWGGGDPASDVLMAALLFDAASIFPTPSHRYGLIRHDASAAAESRIVQFLRNYDCIGQARAC